MTDLAATYDAVPYESAPYPQTHPDRLYTVAALFGLSPAPIDRCRVLEIGCSTGGNLLAMADTAPNSHFVGIDLSPHQIELARSLASRSGASNVEFQALDLRNFPEHLGGFDYIIAHGVYSWMPTDARDALIRLCAAHLTPLGIAYISYNTYPGWYFRQGFREMMLHHIRGITDPDQRAIQARQFLETLATSCPPESNTYGTTLAELLKTIERRPPSYLVHEHLEPYNQPVYFHQFLEHIEAHGLQYLGESSIWAMSDIYLPPPGQDALAQWAKTTVQQQQYLDFLRNTPFRTSLICRNSVCPSEDPNHEVIRRFYVSSSARPEAPVDVNSKDVVSFVTSDTVKFYVSDPMQKVFLRALSNFPQRLSFEQLLTHCSRQGEIDSNHLSQSLLSLYLMNACEFHSGPAPFTLTLTDRPSARRLARVQAEFSDAVTTFQHSRTTLSDFGRQVLLLLDGRRDRAQILDDLERLASATNAPMGEKQRGELAKTLLAELQTFRSVGLLSDRA